MEEIVLSWSGGKDSALAFYELLKNREYRVTSLVTTLTSDYDRISMHGVRRGLLRQQSDSLGIPVKEVWIPKDATNQTYEKAMSSALSEIRENKITRVAFGDLFLRDIREYREQFLQRLGMECIFPIWGKDTRELAEYFVDSGFKAILCCVDPKKLGRDFCGREFDRSLLRELPENVDPCGENGEFHTFVYAGPIFKNEIKVNVGEIISRSEFYFADIGSPLGGGAV